MTAEPYSAELRDSWDAFVDSSKNGTFMLKRGYVDYHADRFQDASVVFRDNDGDIIAVMPASRHGSEIRSHGGLTYGGIVASRRMTTVKMLQVFDLLKEHLVKQRISRLVYKRVPAIYYSYPSDEDLYALFRNHAELSRRDISATIDLSTPIQFSSVRVRYVKKARKNGCEVRECEDYERYVDLLTQVLLSRHKVKPPHTANELRLLATRFPNNIKLFCAYQKDIMLAGVLVFVTPNVVHAQYIANSEEGRRIGALDLVMEFLIHSYSTGRRYFDFGICTENDGLFLNTGLVEQKEMFGGRGIVYDCYALSI